MSEHNTTDEDAAVQDASSLSGLVTIANHAWRLSRLAHRACEKLPEEERKRFTSQVRYLDREIDSDLLTRGIRFVDLAGNVFDPGMAATALNAADFDDYEGLIVTQMIEPVIMGPNGLLRYGVVMLGKQSL